MEPDIIVWKNWIEWGFMLVNVIVVGIAAYWAYRIGTTQNKINERSLQLSDCAEIFLMGQSQIRKDESGQEKVVRNCVVVMNTSAYPIYLNRYVLNGIKTEVGAGVIANLSDTWYEIPVAEYLQQDNLSMEVYFEDYMGRKYKTESTGKFYGRWIMNTDKRVELSSLQR